MSISDTFQKNREALRDIIFEKGDGFTKKELKEEFYKRCGEGACIGFNSNIDDHLTALWRGGFLNYSPDGIYRIP